MVPEVDKQDTEKLLRRIRETAEAVRKEVQSWTLPKDQTSNDAEAQALRKLAVRSAQQTRQWTGRMLAELGSAYPYPNSSDSGTQVIDKTDVPEASGLEFADNFTVVQRIKGTRAQLSELKGELSELAKESAPGTEFSSYLQAVKMCAMQTSMWLGELLHEFYDAQPKAEPVAYDSRPQHSPESLADIAAVESVGTRVVVTNFAQGHALPGLITVAPEPETGYVVVLDKETPMGVKTIALKPTVADAIRDYQIVSEAAAGKALAPGNESAPTPGTEPTSTGSGLGAESSPVQPLPEAKAASSPAPSTTRDAAVNHPAKEPEVKKQGKSVRK